MANPRVLVISDVHIGTNTPTNWYQRTIHEPYLLAIFDYVRQQADSIDELVILGDLVDQWTYLPSVTPPTFGEIAAANPKLFGAPGQPGAITQALTALKGRVTYLHGNHDMAVTAADLATLGDAAGHTLNFPAGPLYQPPAGGGKIVLAHGHIYSIFNAADPNAFPDLGLPIGHFVTRLSALAATQKLKAGQTVADLPDSGDPTGWGLAKDLFASSLQDFLTGTDSLAKLMIGALLDACGVDDSIEFVLSDGRRVTAREVITLYGGVYDRWKTTAEDRAVYGRDPALSALADTDAQNDLSHFALVLGAQFPVVVMGHTHAPRDKADHLLLRADSLYANSGFACPSRADMQNPNAAGQRFPTFVDLVIDADGGACTASIGCVGGDPAAPRVVPEPLTPPVRVKMK